MITDQPSLVIRIGIGKLFGFLFGLTAFLIMPMLMPETNEMFLWAMLLWYTAMGAIIGVFGVFTYHPVLKLPMPWWFRALVIGAWLNFVLTLFIYDQLKVFSLAMFDQSGMFASPFWFVLEGAIIALIIGYFATSIAGEGPEVIMKDHERT